MPLFYTVEEKDFRCCVWKVTETADELLAALPEADKYKAEAASRFSSPKRRLEYAAVRALLYEMTGTPPDVSYLPSGRPFLTDGTAFLSITHTKGYVAVALSPSAVVGVDAEQYGERILSLRDRIVGERERAEDAWSLLLHWSAKETVYKMMDSEGVDFVEHLCVSGIPEDGSSRVKPEGVFLLSSSYPSHRQAYTVHYRLFPDFVLTYSQSASQQ